MPPKSKKDLSVVTVAKVHRTRMNPRFLHDAHDRAEAKLPLLEPLEGKKPLEDSVVVSSVLPPLHAALTRAMASRHLGSSFSGFTPLPEKLSTKLKYAEDYVASGTVNPGVQLWAATSAYSPNQTASGHQPRGFDQIMSFYEWYVVDKCRIKLHIHNWTASTVGVIGICLTAYNTLKTVLSDYTEMPVLRMIAPPAITYDFPIVTLELEYDARKYMGVKDPSDADRLLGTIGASPSDNAFFHCFSSNVDESTLYGVNCFAELEYECTFTQPVQPAES